MRNQERDLGFEGEGERKLMAYWNQRTVARRVSCAGIGLHSGQRAALTLAPAPIDAGVRFVRMDLGVEIPATSSHVADTTLNTTLGCGTARVSTVEHVLAALTGMGVDNCRVEVDGPEVPILDGSAAPFVALIREAGIAVQRAGKRFLLMQERVEVRDGDKHARLDPAESLRIDFTVDFDHPLVSDQAFCFQFSDRAFDREIARARTFCFLKDIERLKAMGLAKGGSLENAIVIDAFSILNPEGLRFPDEFVRHKVLDALGDLTLMGMPVIGALDARKSGHALNQALVRRVLSDPTSYRVVRVSAESQLEPLQIRIPALGLPEGQAA